MHIRPYRLWRLVLRWIKLRLIWLLCLGIGHCRLRGFDLRRGVRRLWLLLLLLAGNLVVLAPAASLSAIVATVGFATSHATHIGWLFRECLSGCTLLEPYGALALTTRS